MYAQHLRKWSLKTKKQLMPLILLIISNMLLYPTMIVAGATATEQHQQQQHQPQQQQQRLWEGSAEESSYYIPLSLDNGSRESSSSSSSSSSSNIDNNILSRLLSHTSNSLSSRSNLKLMPATVFDAPEQHVAAVPQQQQQQQQQQPQQQQQSMQKVPNTLINSQLYNLLNNGKSSEAASSKMRRHIEPTHLQHQLQLQQQQQHLQQLQHLQQAAASNYSRRAVPSYFIESYEVPDSRADQAVRSRRDGGNQQRQHPRTRQQQDKRDHRRLRQQQRQEQRNPHQPRNHHQHKQKQQQQQRRKQHQRKHRGRPGSGKYCSARDPAQLAFAAPTVFRGVFKSMSADRRVNFSATMKVLEVYKQQRDLQLPQLVRLQFALRNTSRECDIYRERLLPRGLLRSGNDLQQASDISYMMFVQQTNPGNFTILGQPVRVTPSVLEAVKMAVSPNYAQNASITSITSVPSNSTIKHGQELKIICKVTGQPPPKVTWFKDDRSINRKRNVYQFKHHKRRSELIVSSFNSSSDAGKYECRAKNKASKAIIKRRIMINAEPVIVRAEPPSMGVPCDNIDYCFHNGTCTFLPDLGEYFCNCANNFFGRRCENSMPDSRRSLQPPMDLRILD
nr:protein vein isoform X3 [Drosophila bipectinata]